jgi:hypothetical protein
VDPLNRRIGRISPTAPRTNPDIQAIKTSEATGAKNEGPLKAVRITSQLGLASLRGHLRIKRAAE